MVRKKNPRRILVAELRSWKAFLTSLISFWDVAGTVAEVHSENGRVTHHTFRERRYEEYRENDPANWLKMADNAERMARHFMNLGTLCRKEARNAAERLAERRAEQ